MSAPEPVDVAAVERAAAAYTLALPRTARAGRAGGVLGARAGGSIELHDFREYQPGDDVRQVDWNAVARSEQLVVRVRREEVAPRVEIVLDGSRSMAITAAKAARARELALLFRRLAAAQGLDSVLLAARDRVDRLTDADAPAFARVPFDGRRPLPEALRDGPSLRPSGIRVVVSDFLFEAPLDAFCAKLAEGTALLVLAQVLDEADTDPALGGTVALVDSESGERLDRELGEAVVSGYRRRFASHQAQLAAAGTRVRAVLCAAPAQEALERTCRERLLGNVLEVRS